MAIASARLADPEAVSAALTVKLAFPAVVGVPLIWPEEARVRPAGNVPELIDHA